MADRIVTIDNNSNNGKSIAICDGNSAAGTYNNSPASIMRSSNNNKATAACSSNELAKTCNNKPTNTTYPEQTQQEWRNSDWKFEGNENNGISQSNKYMNALTPMNPIHLCSNKLQVGHTKCGYAASSIRQEVSLTSENLKKWAILDSGSSSHFLISTAPVMNRKVADRPLQVKLPNGDIIRSSHIAELDLPLLPVAGTSAS